jgi:HEAT repeat protein
MADEQQLAHAVDALAGSGDLPDELLGALSHLVRTDLEAVTAAWTALPVLRRLEVLRQLGTAERKNQRLDFNALYEVALADPTPSVRQLAVESIVPENGPSPLPTISKLAESDPDVSVQEAALRCLGPFALAAELGELDAGAPDRLRALLLGVLKNPTSALGVRREALAAVGYLDNNLVSREIQRGFDDDDLQLWAIQAMGHTANEEWIDTLLGQTTSLDPAIRQAVAYAAGDIAEEEAAEGIAELVDDPEQGVRLAALWALGQIGGDVARETLIYALEDDEEEIRKAAEEAISELEESEDPLGM